ncbi:MAG: hypothetical protein ACOZNI_10480 [Myxococcota bacterium]
MIARVVLLVLVALTGLAAAAGRPTGEPSPEAEALTDRMLAAVNAEAWARTGALRWRVDGRELVWDRVKGRVRVRAPGLDRTVPTSWIGEANVGQEAYRHWVTDSFWLNPVVKLRDPGTRRALVDGGLLVHYEKGGQTPGDTYVWEVGADGLPVAWRAWTKNPNLEGARATWEGWITLATGAKVATKHRFPGGFVLKLHDVEGAETLAELGEAL